MKNNNNPPLISVVMLAYNRKQYIKESLDSILKQTYKNFELIIIDDCSTDGTYEIIADAAKKDSRIHLIRNKKNKGIYYVKSLKYGVELARGKYIARMDDDDIAMPDRFAKQVAFMERNPDISALGTNIDIIDEKRNKVINADNQYKNIMYCGLSPDALSAKLIVCSVICHPSVMIRKSFLDEHKINYDNSMPCAEDYNLWSDIILAGGKINKIPDVLLKYRMHSKSITLANKARQTQEKTKKAIQMKLLSRFFPKKQVAQLIGQNPNCVPYNKKIIDALIEIADKDDSIITRNGIYEYLQNLGIKPANMHIFMGGDKNIAIPMTVAISSLVRNMFSFDFAHFYIMDGGISAKNKRKINTLVNKKVSIEWLRVDDELFKNLPAGGRTGGCHHVSYAAYYRFVIPKLKPNLDKVLYIDYDVAIRASLNLLWNTDLGNNYCAAVEELFKDAKFAIKLKVPRIFNSGVMLINNKKWVADNISDKLFQLTNKNLDKIVYVDQCILNYAFMGRILWLSPIYNAMIDVWRPNTGWNGGYSNVEMWSANNNPVIVHYNSGLKPWKCFNQIKFHRFRKLWFREVRKTPFWPLYYKHKLTRIGRYLWRNVSGSVLRITCDVDFRCVRILKFIKLKFYKSIRRSDIGRIIWYNRESYKYCQELSKKLDRLQAELNQIRLGKRIIKCKKMM